jgi:hypothetical protein
MNARSLFLSAAGLVLSGATAAGYVFIEGNPKWNTSQITMHLELGSSGTLLDGSPSWNAAAQAALGVWNQWIATTQFVGVADNGRTPADGDRVNDVFFDNTVYGFDFGNAVAVTTTWTSGSRRIEGDTIFNSTLSWNSYRGALKRASGGGTLYDLRRVAIHEFGHTLGLDHPDEAGQSVVAIMNSHVSDIDDAQPDDERGAQALYGVGAAGTPSESSGSSNSGGNVTTDSRASFTAPLARRITTTASRYRFRGTADPSRVQAVYLVSSRLRGRLLPVSGRRIWSRFIALRPGRNAIRLLIDPGNGSRVSIDTRVIFRISP